MRAFLRPVPILLVATTSLAAQETSRDTARAEPIVVSATRTPMRQGSLPVAVTVLTGEQLRVQGITTVADALAGVSSAYVAQAGSQGAQTSLFLRGGESKYVKVLIDGVPVNDPGGVYDFASLTTDNIERIEVVRGPASVIHGADAVTGVVHVITRNGGGPLRGSVETRVGAGPRQRLAAGAPAPGNLRVFDASASIDGARENSSYSLALARHETSGLYELNNEFHNNVLSGRFHFAPASHTDVRVALRYNDYRYNYPTTGGGSVEDRNAHRVEDRTVLGVEVERRLTPRVAATLAVNSSVNEGGTDDAMDAPGGNSFVSQDKIRRRGAEARLRVLAASSTWVTLGVQKEQQDQRSQFQSQSPFGPFADSFRAARRSSGAYAEVALAPAGAFAATVGARVDDNEQFGAFGTARAGASWRPIASTRFRATAGTAFREPSFFENYASGFVTGNPGLRPERTITFDGGLDHDFLAGRAVVSVTGFAQRFVNMIDYESTSSACGYSYCNVAEATSRGVETEVRGRVHGPLSASVAATFLRTRVVEPGYDSTQGGLYRRGESLIRRPGRNISVELAYAGAGRLSASARLLAVGMRRDRDFRSFPAEPVTLPSYERIDVGGECTLRSRVSLTARIENLGDRRYENVFNFLTPRRVIATGIRARF